MCNNALQQNLSYHLYNVEHNYMSWSCLWMWILIIGINLGLMQQHYHHRATLQYQINVPLCMVLHHTRNIFLPMIQMNFSRWTNEVWCKIVIFLFFSDTSESVINVQCSSRKTHSDMCIYLVYTSYPSGFQKVMYTCKKNNLLYKDSSNEPL